MPTRDPRSVARSDIVSIAVSGFMIGAFSVMAMVNAAREHWLEACLYALIVPPLAFAVVFVARRMLRKIPEQSTQQTDVAFRP